MKTNWLSLLILVCGFGLCVSLKLLGGEQTAPQQAAPPVAMPAVPESKPFPTRPDTGRRGRRAISENEKNNTAIKAAFRETVAPASAATVRILADGKAVALGTVVDANGYIASKASLLKGDLICRFKDGRELATTIVGEDTTNDLAVLHVDAKGLPVVEWRIGALPPSGSIVAAVGTGDDPLAIGVVSADLRKIRGSTRDPGKQGWLGVSLNANKTDVFIENVIQGSPAEKANLKLRDQLKTINGQAIKSVEQVIGIVGGSSSGDTLRVLVQRNNEFVELPVTLGQQSPKVGRSSEDKWGGGPFSSRRWGFPTVLPHDIAILPNDCGGPLVDTDGKVVGINIARALRVTSFAPACRNRPAGGKKLNCTKRRRSQASDLKTSNPEPSPTDNKQPK